MFYNKHYIKTDNQNRVIDAWSDGPRADKDTAGAICVNEQGGYQLELLGETNPTSRTMEGVPLYRWDGVKVVRRAAVEIQADIDALPKPEPQPDTAALIRILLGVQS